LSADSLTASIRAIFSSVGTTKGSAFIGISQLSWCTGISSRTNLRNCNGWLAFATSKARNAVLRTSSYVASGLLA
jgi:hypothetical protein